MTGYLPAIFQDFHQFHKHFRVKAVMRLGPVQGQTGNGVRFSYISAMEVVLLSACQMSSLMLLFG